MGAKWLYALWRRRDDFQYFRAISSTFYFHGFASKSVRDKAAFAIVALCNSIAASPKLDNFYRFQDFFLGREVFWLSVFRPSSGIFAASFVPLIPNHLRLYSQICVNFGILEFLDWNANHSKKSLT
jgi:hypothetical protein